MKKPDCYVEIKRRAGALSQPELAFLLGWQSGSPVSLLEKGREPYLSKAFALELLFGVSPADLFPALMIATEDELARRAYELRLSLQAKPSKKNDAKIRLLNEVLARLLERTKQRQG